MEAKIKNELSTKFLKGLDSSDPVFDREGLWGYSERQLLDFSERFANQRVIEELEMWIEKGDEDGGGVFTSELWKRVNELSIKQE